MADKHRLLNLREHAKWRRVLPYLQAVQAKINSQTKYLALSNIHAQVNSIKYVPDTDNYGVADYWQTPDEFVRYGGDCEDYAIAKYARCLEVGFTDQEVSIVVGMRIDLNMLHAVLYAPSLGYVSCNLEKYLLSITHYEKRFKKYYSLTRAEWRSYL